MHSDIRRERPSPLARGRRLQYMDRSATSASATSARTRATEESETFIDRQPVEEQLRALREEVSYLGETNRELARLLGEAQSPTERSATNPRSYAASRDGYYALKESLDNLSAKGVANYEDIQELYSELASQIRDVSTREGFQQFLNVIKDAGTASAVNDYDSAKRSSSRPENQRRGSYHRPRPATQ